MREYLFRGKRVDNGEWVEGDLVHSTDGNVYIIQNFNAGGFISFLIIPETVGEYTGLNDKKGKKIFKGDIVRYSDKGCYYPEEYTEFIGDIVFEKGAFGIGSRDELPIDLDYWCDNDNFVSLWELYWNLNCCQNELPILEVIGNIHDNPELLK